MLQIALLASLSSNGFSIEPSKISMPPKRRLRNRNKLSGMILSTCSWSIPCHRSVCPGVFFKSALILIAVCTISCSRLTSCVLPIKIVSSSEELSEESVSEETNGSFCEAFVNVFEMTKSD